MSSSAIPGDHPLWRAAAPGPWQSAQLLSHSGARLILAFLWPSAVLAIARPSFGRSFSPRRLAIILFCSGCSGTSSALIDRSVILGGYMVFVLSSFIFIFSLIVSLSKPTYPHSRVSISSAPGLHPLLFTTSRGVWCSYSWCLSTPYVEWEIQKTKTKQLLFYRHCRCRLPYCNDADIVDAVPPSTMLDSLSQMPAKPMLP